MCNFAAGNRVTIHGRRGQVVGRQAYFVTVDFEDGERRDYDVDELRTWNLGIDHGPAPCYVPPAPGYRGTTRELLPSEERTRVIDLTGGNRPVTW